MKTIYEVFFTLSGHIAKLLLGFIILKLISYYLGPSGLGYLGHFMSLVTIVSMVAGGGILNGLIKYVSEYKEEKIKLIRFISSSISYSIYFSIIILLIFLLFSKEISILIFGVDEYYLYIITLGFAQLFYSFISIVIGVCNGLGEYKTYVKIQIISLLISLPCCWFLIYFYDFKGALLSIIFALMSPSLPALYYVLKGRIFYLIKLNLFNTSNKVLVKYTLMLIVSAMVFPIVEIFVREKIILNSGYEEAGLWQAAIRLSSAYIGLFATFLAFWFMPKISAEKSWFIIGVLSFKTMFFVMFAFVFGAVIFIQFPYFFINILLSSKFHSLADIIIYQLLGDFFKISAFVIGFVIVAKAKTSLYVVGELFQGLLFLCIIFYMGGYIIDAQKIMKLYALTNIIYFSIMIISFSFVLYQKSKKSR